MKKIVILVFIVTTLLGCITKDNSCGQAYFGGEIINPNNDFLVLYDNTTLIDTLYLDENNRFFYHIESLNSGLCRIAYGGESQFAIIEPNDSLMIRLNTLDFDESFVYSGRGSKKNNYFINLFLSLEKEDNSIYKFSKLKPELFLKKLDSMKMESYNALNTFYEKYPTSNLFKKISRLSIDYSYYKRKEVYPLRYFGMNTLVNLDSLPQGYYNFRNNIEYNEEQLTEFYPYYYFLFNHFNNLSSEKYFEETGNSVLIRTNIIYNLNKVELVDSLVHSKKIKNVLLKFATRNFLSKSTSFEDSEAMYNSYISKNTDKDNAEYITGLYNTLKRLQPGNILPEVDVVNYKNEISTINNICVKPFVLYFWSNTNKYYVKNSHRKLNELRKNYSNIDFISINVNSNNASVWKRILKQNSFDIAQEYRFRNPQVAKKLLAIEYINKVIVVNSDKTIVNSNSNMFDHNFKNLLNQLK